MRSHLHVARKYLREIRKQIALGWGWTPVQWVRYYPRWMSALDESSTPISRRSPWITFAAVDFLQGWLTPEKKVFEYGIGGSTLFFLDRVARLVSVEHDPEWCRVLSRSLTKEEVGRWDLKTVPPENPAFPDDGAFATKGIDYRSSSPGLEEMTFRTYVRAIERFPDGEFDLVMIDGRARPSCLLHARKKVKIGGVIVLDNSEREAYSAAMESMSSGWARMDFPGPSPDVDFFTRTTAWLRRREDSDA